MSDLSRRTDADLSWIIHRGPESDAREAVEELKRRAESCAYGPKKRAEIAAMEAMVNSHAP